MLGINQSAYAKIEQGNTQLTVDRLKQIAKALKTNMFELVGEEVSGNVIIGENGTIIGNQLCVIQNSFENERKAFQAHITDLQKQVESLQKMVEKLIGK
jgi:transcriptional regulator with XRE-family HTH domain